MEGRPLVRRRYLGAAVGQASVRLAMTRSAQTRELE
jgi:hypothetical protein